MGKLIKNHWARLIILTAALYQCAAALEGFFWPKIFWDFLTKNLDAAVKPFPILQIINLLFGLFALALPTVVFFITLADGGLGASLAREREAWTGRGGPARRPATRTRSPRAASAAAIAPPTAPFPNTTVVPSMAPSLRVDEGRMPAPR